MGEHKILPSLYPAAALANHTWEGFASLVLTPEKIRVDLVDIMSFAGGFEGE
jgi:hypothetical protein